MFIFYRLARDAGHSVLASMAFALFNRRLPQNPVPLEQRQAESPRASCRVG
jgi:hypothetical protein